MHPCYLQFLQILFLLLFFDTYSLSMSSLGYKALCISISLLVFGSICLSSSLVHFKNGLQYLMRGTAWVFIPFIRFLQCSLILSNFFIFLFEFFFSSPLVWWCQLPIFPIICSIIIIIIIVIGCICNILNKTVEIPQVQVVCLKITTRMQSAILTDIGNRTAKVIRLTIILCWCCYCAFLLFHSL